MERERKLASVQKILSLTPIEGADKIEVARVLGWNVVVEKGLHSVGDAVVYCEVDSLLPLKPEFEFLARGSKPKKMYIDGKEVTGYRLKTVKLRGQISQGIVFPLNIIPPPEGVSYLLSGYIEGFDVTDLLGIFKYEMPLPTELAGKVRGGFPGFLPKTDEPRLQANPSLLERYKDQKFYLTEKVDGSSVTICIKNDELHVCSRNLDLLETPDNSIWRVARELNIEQKMRDCGLQEKIALQGEIFGAGIQSNPLKQSKVSVRFYNAYDFANGYFLSFNEFKELFSNLKLDTVPVIFEDFNLLPTVDEMVTYVTRKSVINPSVDLEGIVFRTLTEQQDPDIGRVSFKVVNPRYLLKHES